MARSACARHADSGSSRLASADDAVSHPLLRRGGFLPDRFVTSSACVNGTIRPAPSMTARHAAGMSVGNASAMSRVGRGTCSPHDQHGKIDVCVCP